MQDFLDVHPDLIADMKNSLSPARFHRYLQDADGSEKKAFELYQWNALLSQSLYISLQCWEICLRNKLNEFLKWKYCEAWPYDQKRAVRNFVGVDSRRLAETLDRQHRSRRLNPVSTGAVVADLSAGFWVSLLSSSYEVTFSWRYNLVRVFPNERTLSRADAWKICDATLQLRNRVAHHEPIYHLPLEQIYTDLEKTMAGMCHGTRAFVKSTCTFQKVIAMCPF